MKTKNLMVIGATVVVLAVGIYFIPKIKKSKERSKLGSDTENTWTEITLTRKEAEIIAKEIKNAKGMLWGLGNDDEDAVYKALSSIKTKTNFKYVSDVFLEEYGEAIIGYIENMFSDDETSKVTKIISNYK